jgi:hypothetical protein
VPDELGMVVPGQYGEAAPDAVGDTHLRSRRGAELESRHVEDNTGEAGDPAVEPKSRSARVWLSMALLGVNVPIVVATIRALSRGWQPLGDNGVLLVRAQDVGTAHNPLLGSWSSSSLLFDQNLNNPGPLYFDAIALPIKLLGPWVGLAIGVMLVNMAASTLAVVAARRISGTESMVAVALAVIGLQWALGSELLFDLWQPNALVLPAMAFLVVATVLARGDLAMAPWFAGLGSLLVQTHLSYVPLVAVVAVSVVVLAMVAIHGARRVPRWRGPLVWTCVVLVGAWAQPVVEQFTGRGEGNLSRLAGAVVQGNDQATIGMSRALRLLAEVTVVGPWFTRSSYDGAVPPIHGDAPIPGLLAILPAALVLTVAMAVLVGLTVAGRRWLADPGLTVMAGTSIVALCAGVAALASSPVNITGLAVHGLRWVWPIAALVSATMICGVLVGLRSRRGLSRVTMALCMGLVLVTAVANLPTHVSRSWGPVLFTPTLPTAQQLVGGLDALDGRDTVLFDPTGLRYGEPYSGLVLAEMQERGIPFVFDDEGLIRQFGEGRRNRGDATLRLWQVEGEEALVRPRGVERIAFARGPGAPVALLVEPIVDR